MDFWNRRYCQQEFAYGITPNLYLKEKLVGISAGKILFPADGEGRNSVFAAKLGWQTEAFDSSSEGKRKADLLAKDNGVSINYIVSDIENINYLDNTFDAIALIYTHFSSEQRRIYHRKLAANLKNGGMLILEVFSKAHLAYQKLYPNVGGPKNIDLLYDLEELKTDFEGFDFFEQMETETTLSEGSCHVGKASVIRILARKNN